jgi:hypothetical protein
LRDELALEQDLAERPLLVAGHGLGLLAQSTRRRYHAQRSRAAT